MLERIASRVRTLLSRRSRVASRARVEVGGAETDGSFDPYQVPQMAVVA